MVERRYTEEEEALEIKSLRRIIAAYAKYAHPSRLSLLP
jgi:carnosine N-methyltransferase